MSFKSATRPQKINIPRQVFITNASVVPAFYKQVRLWINIPAVTLLNFVIFSFTILADGV